MHAPDTEGAVEGNRFKEGDSPSPHIGTSVRILAVAARQFGTHVGRGSQELCGAGHGRLALDPRQPHVRQHIVPICPQDQVTRLDVQVGNTRPVQRSGTLDGPQQREENRA